MGEPNLETASDGPRGAQASGPGALLLAVILGLAGVVFICMFVHFFETVIGENGESTPTVGSALTPMVFFMVFLVLLVLNPVLHYLQLGLQFGRREMTIIFAMWLLTGAICYNSFAEPILSMSGTFMAPEFTKPVLTRTNFKDNLPPQLFLDPKAASDFQNGLGAAIHRISPDRIPWSLWRRPLMYWIPFMLVMFAITSSLMRMMHRQWSQHELLAYPIASVADTLIGQRPGRVWPNVFYNKIFWLGFGITALVTFVNGLAAWFPDFPAFKLGYWYSDLVRDFPFLNKYCANYVFSFFRWLIIPYIIGLVVLLPTEVSLTCWLGWVLTLLGTGVYFLMTGTVIADQATGTIHYGMFAALAVFVVVIGRREYGRIIKHAILFRRSDDPVINQAAVACWVFIAASLALIGLLVYAGLDPVIAVIVAILFSMFIIVLARITAEVGFPFLWDYLGTVQYMTLQLLGAAAVGPKGLVVLGCIGGMLDFSPQNTIAANETTYRKLEERAGRRFAHGWFNLLLFGTACLAIAATIYFYVWDNYSFGAQKESVTRTYFDKHIMVKMGPELETLQTEGHADELNATHGFAKLGLIQAKEGFWRFFIYGALLVGLCALMRLRFAWWPFHPLPLLFFNIWAMSRFFASFLIGWFIKVALTRIGGGRVYMESRPFFVGVIVGQVTIGCVWVAVAYFYYVFTKGALPREAIWYMGS